MDCVNAKQATMASGSSQSDYVKAPEFEISSERFDQSFIDPAACRRKYIICSTQRSGSFLLCRQLLNAGIGVPQEYFNTLHLDLLCRRWNLDPQDLPTYVRSLYSRRTTTNDVWGTKLQWAQYGQYRQLIDQEVLDGSRYIFLYRANDVAQAISLHISLVTGIWGFEGAKTTKVQPAKLYDLNQLARCARRIKDENEQWQSFFTQRHITPLVIRYEDFAAHQQDFVQRIAQFLGLSTTEYRVPAPEERKNYRSPEIEVVWQELMKRYRAAAT